VHRGNHRLRLPCARALARHRAGPDNAVATSHAGAYFQTRDLMVFPKPPPGERLRTMYRPEKIE